jgi:hypothetical protein
MLSGHSAGVPSKSESHQPNDRHHVVLLSRSETAHPGQRRHAAYFLNAGSQELDRLLHWVLGRLSVQRMVIDCIDLNPIRFLHPTQ